MADRYEDRAEIGDALRDLADVPRYCGRCGSRVRVEEE